MVSLVPEFDIGWWNAWIILIPFYLVSFAPFMFGAETSEARMDGEPSWRQCGPGVRMATIVTHGIFMPLTPLYALFVPLERGTWWLYAGLVVSAAATALALAAALSFARAPLDRPMTHGAYTISRHPMYVSMTVIYVGVGLAATSWVFLVCAVIEAMAWRAAVPEEERIMVDEYGVAYQAYMQRTPRWIGPPKRLFDNVGSGSAATR
jgi:protein-S-isoprenylcysteine O-methyltransferase Ste14